MAIRTGASTIIKAAKIICRMIGLFGTRGLQEATNSSFVAAALALVAACQAFEAADDHPFAIDTTAPFGPEDVPPV